MLRLLCVTAAALAALALPPAAAADADAPKSASVRGTEDGDRPGKPDKRTAERTGDDLASCRRDADGMRGPERSRFMTQCLKERK